jgi:hypothetical protein
MRTTTSQPRRSRSVRRFLALVVAGSFVVSACGQAGDAGTDAGTATTTSSTSDATASTIAIGPDAETVKVEMSSKDNTLYEIGPDSSQTYGQNILVGESRVLGEDAQVEILGNVNYTKGSGPFFGFLTVRWSDGSAVVFDMDGEAVRSADGATELRSDLGFIGGAGRYVDTPAAAEFRGSRAAAVGSPIVIELTLDVADGSAD